MVFGWGVCRLDVGGVSLKLIPHKYWVSVDSEGLIPVNEQGVLGWLI